MTQQRLEIQRFSPFVEVRHEGENAYDAALSRLKHRFDCSAALRVSPRIAPLFICPAAIVLARGRPFRRCRRSSPCRRDLRTRTEEHTSELQSLMRISYAVLCLTKKKTNPK